MKIVYLANARIPTEKAHGIQIMKMCESFSNQGKEVELVVAWRFNNIKKDVFDYYGILENFKIKRLFSLDLTSLRVLGRFAFRLQALTFSISVFFYFLFKKQDIIYCRNPLVLSFLGWFKKNIVYEMHTVPRNFFIYKWIFKRAKAIVVITQGIKDSFIKKGIDNDKILVAPDGVDLDKFDIDISKKEARKKLDLPLDKKIVLYTGHLYKWKGAQTLAQVSKYLDNIIVIFVGGTKKDIKIFKKENEDFDNILILGHQSYSEIPYYLKAADVLVLPNSTKERISREWTSPMKMFEYMASRVPIIASDLPSLREVLNQNNAILVKPDDVQSLANGINQSLKNPNFSDKISKQAYQDVQKYTWGKRTEIIISFLNND